MKPLFCLFLLFSLAANSQQQTYTDNQKIDHLITYISKLNDAVFIRNESEHSAKDAAAHLQMKREKAGKRIKTVEDFIVKLASKSSMSGEPYMIRFKNGKEFSCEMVLRLELKRLMEGKSTLLVPKS